MGTFNVDKPKPEGCASCCFYQDCPAFSASFAGINKTVGPVEGGVRNWWKDLDSETWMPSDHRLSGCPLFYVHQEHDGQPDGYTFTYPDNTTNCWPTTADYRSGGQYASLNS